MKIPADTVDLQEVLTLSSADMEISESNFRLDALFEEIRDNYSLG